MPLRIELPLDSPIFTVLKDFLVTGRGKGMEGEESAIPVVVIDKGMIFFNPLY